MAPTGKVHVYTGNGKGKTTAALGLALRACGAGLRVYLGQFIKSGEYSEITALSTKFPEVTVEQYGRKGFLKGKPEQEDIDAAIAGLKKAHEAMLSGRYDIIILDEACTSVSAGLFEGKKLACFCNARPDDIEVVFTGRNAPEELLEIADLVTEMKEIKHYFRDGLQARKGIEK